MRRAGWFAPAPAGGPSRRPPGVRRGGGPPARGALRAVDGVRRGPGLARRVRWVGLDVDGVLTDGGIYLGDVAGQRYECKRYDIQDGLGILMLRMAGVLVGIVTGRVSD